MPLLQLDKTAPVSILKQTKFSNTHKSMEAIAERTYGTVRIKKESVHERRGSSTTRDRAQNKGIST